jgi:hypothetical protein
MMLPLPGGSDVEFDLTALGLGHACRAAAPKQRLKMIGPGREIRAFVIVTSAVGCCLLGLFCPLTLTETDPGTTAVLVDEFYTGRLKRLPSPSSVPPR